MKYFIITFVVIMFAYFVVRYKLFPGIHRKAGKPEASGGSAVSGIPARTCQASRSGIIPGKVAALHVSKYWPFPVT